MSLRSGLSVLAKKLVRLQGSDALPLLNGLLTNDVNSSQQVVYSYLLNSQGRVLFDLFLYKFKQDDVLLEVDASQEQSLIKVLNFYKLRRSVTIGSSALVACVAPSATPASHVLQAEDPRLPELGHKIIFETPPSDDVAPLDVYRELRYRLGVPEGAAELGVGKAIPLESNGDHLRAISFEKGCYIGQELTARAYHTGVIRKRYMPLKFSETPAQPFEPGTDPIISNQKAARVGVLKAVVAKRGLGLMRIKESLEAEELRCAALTSAPLGVAIPPWWPKTSH